MRAGLYRRLAWNNLRKNARLYVPNVLTGVGLTAVFYILYTLSQDQRLHSVRGGRYLPTVMAMGVIVIGLLSVILMLYTNRFLMKQRNREFGLYNVLGLEKRHIGKILFWETATCALLAVGLGLLAGMVLYKLCALVICRVLAVESVLGFYYISLKTLAVPGLYFLGIYALMFVLNGAHIRAMKPVELLESANVGEREPKVKWFLLLVGLGSLAAGYWISVTSKDPYQTLNLFFVAVILVIIGTYCLFLTGTTAALKLLKKNKQFYYRKNHMVSVSGLLYRMKQNALGLASIAILATMVLVMVSSTVSLYAGIEDTLERKHPHHLSLSANYGVGEESVAIPGDVLLEMIRETAEEKGLQISNVLEERYLGCAFGLDGETLRTDWENPGNTGRPIMCIFMTAGEYQKHTGLPVDLAEGELAFFSKESNAYGLTENLTIGMRTFRCVQKLDSFPVMPPMYAGADGFGFVVRDEAALEEIYTLQKEAYQEAASEMTNRVLVDFSDEKAAEKAWDGFYRALGNRLRAYVEAQPGSNGGYGSSTQSLWEDMEYYYGMYGTLMFLGLLLSTVFLLATALIIYYKQISEGYEDAARFQIMQKVGMSGREVRASITSQILLVFFLPLGVAAVHMAFAFPMLTHMLEVLFDCGKTLFLGCTVGALGLFAVIYVMIYSVTARVYYRIVK